MYKEHSVFEPIPDDTVIWRYMNFEKICSLLLSKSLFFNRSDLFPDNYECLLPDHQIKLDAENMRKIQSGSPNPTITESYIEANKRSIIFMPKTFYICCFHMNDYENGLLWDKYSKNDVPAIAIKSTICRLKECFNLEEKYSQYLGCVKYIDYDEEFVPRENEFSKVLYKRKQFSAENEVRAVVWDILNILEKNAIPNKLKIENNDIQSIIDAMAGYSISDSINHDNIASGLNICVNLNTLIEGIYISPNSLEWVRDLIQQLIELINKTEEEPNKLKFLVYNSTLDRIPNY